MAKVGTPAPAPKVDMTKALAARGLATTQLRQEIHEHSQKMTADLDVALAEAVVERAEKAGK